MSNKNSIIQLSNLTKSFGKNRGVTNINLSVPKGSVFGFLGPNGAGKSTTINMILGFTSPNKGSISVFNKSVSKESINIRKNIGFLASDMSLDGSLTGLQQLEYHGRLRGNFDKKYVSELAIRLQCDLSKKIKTLSRGNHQKVALISAFMHKPELLILDEPTSGLDPIMQAEFNTLISEHKARGGTTFISSHVLSEVQELCDHIAFIRSGELIANTTMKELVEDAPRIVSVNSPDSSLEKAVNKLNGASEINVNGNAFEFIFRGNTNNLLNALTEHNILDIIIKEPELEDLFMKYYQKEGEE